MILFKKIRLSAGNRKLNKRLKKIRRFKKACNLSEARSVGIIISASEEHEWPEYKKFIDYLQVHNLKITVMAYIRKKKLTDYYSRLHEIHFFSDPQLTVFFIPQLPVVEEFIKTRFDILIDLCLDCAFPTTYITAMSVAGFKVGTMNNCHTYYDFMIDLGNLKNKTLFIDQIIHYLTILNNEKALASL